mmetsp:Transcript_34191/g.33391  ORF Transcript_34191/g.33391 Transcript_34191/m.33391 type:complete len:96 (-) Transcript_34191:460-747(-)
MQFTGWFHENVGLLVEKLDSGMLTITFTNEHAYIPFGDFEIKGLMTHLFTDDSFQHFVTNSCPAIRDKYGSVRIFSGDTSMPLGSPEVTMPEFDQ